MSALGAVKIGNGQLSLQHLTSLPATSALAKPVASHIGQINRNVFPLAGRGDSAIAREDAAASTPNGSSSAASLGFEGADLAAGLLDVVGALAAGAAALETAGFVATFGGGALLAPPFIEAPQNGQCSASSSSTDCLQAGQVANISSSIG